MMTATTMRRLTAVLLLGGVLAAGCGGGGDDGNDGVASIDENAGRGRRRPDDEERPATRAVAASTRARCRTPCSSTRSACGTTGSTCPIPSSTEGGGVSIGFEPGSGIDPESEEFQAAEEECQSILDEVRPDVQLSPEEQAEMQDRLVAMAECMRARGHDMPDPQVSDDGGVRITRGPAGDGVPGAGEGPPDDEFEQDMEECSEEAGMEGGPGFSPVVGGRGMSADAHLRPTPGTPAGTDPADPTDPAGRAARPEAETAVTTPDSPDPIRLDGRRPGRRRRTTVLVAGGALAVLAAGVIAWRSGDDDDPAAGPSDAVATTTAEVTVRDLEERTELDGTLGYGETSELALAAQGTVTWLPARGLGHRSRPGGRAGVDDRVVPLLFGDRPVWARPRFGGRKRTDPTSGLVEANLVALGVVTADELTVDEEWTSATTDALEEWQEAVGLDDTGRLVPAGRGGAARARPGVRPRRRARWPGRRGRSSRWRARPVR